MHKADWQKFMFTLLNNPSQAREHDLVANFTRKIHRQKTKKQVVIVVDSLIIVFTKAGYLKHCLMKARFDILAVQLYVAAHSTNSS